MLKQLKWPKTGQKGHKGYSSDGRRTLESRYWMRWGVTLFKKFIRLLFFWDTLLFKQRLHWSRAQLAKISRHTEASCDRCKQSSVTWCHMFWSCVKIFHFWDLILKTFSTIFGWLVVTSMYIALFGEIPLDVDFSRAQADVVSFCSLLSRGLILCKWKDSSPPTYGHLIKDVTYYLQLEKICCFIILSLARFFATW